MTKISQLPADSTPGSADLVPVVNNTTNVTSKMTMADFSKIMSSLLQPSGLVMQYAGGTAPANWLLCDGSAVSRTTYANLFAAVGTTYGSGDGSTTFNLPDLRGRVVAGKDNMGGTSANRLTGGSGAVGTLDGDILGNTGGTESHWHWQTFGNDGGGLYFAVAGAASALAANSHSTVITVDRNTIGAGSRSSSTARFDGTGDSSTVQPTLIMNYIIKT